MSFIKCYRFGVVAFLYAIATTNVVYADDTEIFFNSSVGSGAGTGASVQPNVLFIFDTSGSMNTTASGSNQARIDVMRDVMLEFLDSIDGLNIGMSRFSNRPGGPILNAIFNVNAATDPVVLSQVSASDDDASERLTGNQMTYDATVIEFNKNNDTDLVGLRFTDIDIPQGARIVSASITVSSDDTIAGNPTYEIFAEKVADAAPFTGDKLSDRALTRTTEYATWTPEEFVTVSPLLDEEGNPNPPSTYAAFDDLVPPVSDVAERLVPTIQEVVNQGSWCGGNSMAFFIRDLGDNNIALRNFITYDGNPLFAPRIRIEFDADPANIATNLEAVTNAAAAGVAPGCFQNRATRQITNGDHDFEVNTGGAVELNSSVLDFYSRGTGQTNDAIGLHFDNVLVPSNVEILNAYIEFVAAADNNGAANAVIRLINAVDASSTAADIIGGTKFAGVSWSLPSFTNNVIYETPSLVTPIQSLVDQAGWVSGNSISVLIETTSGNRDVVSFEQTATRAPRLVIEYKGAYTGTGYTKRDEMREIVQDFQARGLTPISDILLEAGLYYRGEEVKYGLERGSPANRNNRISNPNSFDSSGIVETPSGCNVDVDPNSSACTNERILGSPNYVSPIIDSCQKNHIVLLTDGAPTSHDTETESVYNRWSGGSCSSANSGQDCAIKIAGYLATNDQSSSLPGSQFVNTHVIAFDYQSEFLSTLAKSGNGFYFIAQDRDALLEKLREIANSILKTNSTFVSAGLTVNQYNRLTSNDELYYSLFAPGDTKSWDGNVKRYRLFDGEVVDVNGNPAVDPLNGEFVPTARSWWSNSVDGNEVAQGGAAGEQSIPRTLYTDVSTASMTAASNRVELGNALITEAMLGATDAADRDAILEWALGYELSDPTRSTPHQLVGDPLHSKPVLMIYNDTSGSERRVMFVGTNNGYLHAFDAGKASTPVVNSGGYELWSFIPEELLGILKEKKENNPAFFAGDRKYGMDGDITVYHEDTNKNTAVDAGERVLLYAGMRRGGKSYFAFDVSNPDAPNFLFKIDPSKSGFDRMGQSWSKPVIARINYGGVDNRLVMIFGGGYDPVHDPKGLPLQSVTQGDRLYIADALTGAYIWDSSLAAPIPGGGTVSSMNSVPADIRAIDFDADGLLDHIYAADMAGQIFRFDIDNDAQTIFGGRLARMQNGVTVDENRHFYNAPDIAFVRDFASGNSFMSVSIGSGFRAGPLDTLKTEHMYSIRDRGVLSGVIEKQIEIGDLVQQTFADSNGDGVFDTAEILADDANGKLGWYFDLPREGEKVLSDSVTFNNALLFTTYSPPTATSTTNGSCIPPAGKSRLYGLSVVDGTPYIDINYDGTIDEYDIFVETPGDGITAGPQLIQYEKPTDEGSGFIVCLGRVCGFEEFLSVPAKRLVPLKWRHVLD